MYVIIYNVKTIMNIWKIDPMHSEVQFKIKHLMISNVTGSFKDFDATLESESDGDFKNAKVNFSAKAGSIDTGNTDRDGHLRSNDFFNAEEYPELKFESTEFQANGSADSYILKGNLTVRDVTRPVELKAEFGGKMTDFYGNEKAGFDLEGKMNRKDFGLTWNGVTEAGGVVVSDEVKLLLNIQMTKEKE